MRTRPSRLESYLLVHVLTAVAGALAIIGSIVMLINFVEISRTIGVRSKEAGLFDVFSLTLLESPSTILVMMPFAFLFGVLAAYVNLNRRSELVALRAAGVSAWRFIAPAAVAAAVVGVITVVALNPIASAMNERYQRLQTKLLEGYLSDQPKAIWLRQGDGRTQIIIRADAREGPGVLLKRVSMYVYRLDPNGALLFSRRIDADTARLSKHAWTLTNARDGRPGQQAIRAPTMTVPSNLNPRTAVERFVSPAAIPFWSLPSIIARTEKAGFSAVGYRLQFDQLLAVPLLYAAMTMLAAAFSLRLIRLGGLAGLAGAAVALGFVFFFLNQFMLALGKAGVVPPLLAAWVPPLLALLAAVTLLSYTEDG